MIGAEAAIIGATPLHRGVVHSGHFRALDKDFAAATVVIDIVGEEYAHATMFGAMLEQEDLIILEHDLALELAVATRADGEGHVVCRGERARSLGPSVLDEPDDEVDRRDEKCKKKQSEEHQSRI